MGLTSIFIIFTRRSSIISILHIILPRLPRVSVIWALSWWAARGCFTSLLCLWISWWPSRNSEILSRISCLKESPDKYKVSNPVICQQMSRLALTSNSYVWQAKWYLRKRLVRRLISCLKVYYQALCLAWNMMSAWKNYNHLLAKLVIWFLHSSSHMTCDWMKTDGRNTYLSR